MKGFHHLHDSDVRAIVDECVICLRGVGPAPRVGEGVELHLADLPARLAEENIVIGVRVKRRIEINKIDTCIGKLFPIGKPFQIIAVIQAVHAIMFFVTSSGAPVATQLQHTLPDDNSEGLLAPVEQRTLSVPISEAN